jgi:hypothetical protein
MLNRIFATITISSLLTAASLLPSRYLNKVIAQVPQETNKTNSSDQSNQAVSPAISPTKRSLIKELLEITQASKSANQVIDVMVRSELPKLVSAILKNVPSLDSDRPEVQKQFNDFVSRMAVKYRDRVLKKIDLKQLVEQVSYPVYDQYFTESELRDIIGFYKSSTGKKAISVLPQITVDSISRTNDILLPKLSSIMTEIVTEELLNGLPKPK